MKYLFALVVTIAGFPLGALVLMWTVGVVHGEWLPELPTLSYHGALVIIGVTGGWTIFNSIIKGVLDIAFKKRTAQRARKSASSSTGDPT